MNDFVVNWGIRGCSVWTGGYGTVPNDAGVYRVFVWYELIGFEV